jgi:hypothetical protein
VGREEERDLAILLAMAVLVLHLVEQEVQLALILAVEQEIQMVQAAPLQVKEQEDY